MPGQICESSSIMVGGGKPLIRACSVILDDVLAAVDAHVARHVFGMLLLVDCEFRPSVTPSC